MQIHIHTTNVYTNTNTKSQIPGKEAVTARATAPKAERVTKNPVQPGDNVNMTMKYGNKYSGK